MLASVGAHIIFFAGSSLLSAQESDTVEKLRVVSLLPSQQSAVQQPPQNPNAPLPVPALPPKGPSSFEGLPTLRPGEQPQAFRQSPAASANPNLESLAKEQQALRQQLALRKQQQAIQQQQRAIQAQRQAQQQAQQQALQRKRVLEADRQQRAQQQARANPLTNDPPGGWTVGSEDVEVPSIAAGQNPNFGPQGNQRDGFPLGNPPADTKTQAANPGSTAAPLDPEAAKRKLSKANAKIAEVRTFLGDVVKLSGRIPENKNKPETLAPPSGADLSQLDEAVVEVRTYVTKEGKKAATRVVEKTDQEVLNQAALAAVEKYQPDTSDFDKTLVFRYSFKPGDAAPSASGPGQASDAAQPGQPAKEDEGSAQSPKTGEADQEKPPAAKDDKKKDKPAAADSPSKPEESRAKEEKGGDQSAPKADSKPAEKTAKPPAGKVETKTPAKESETPAAKEAPAATSPQSQPEPEADKTSDAVGGVEPDTTSASEPKTEAEKAKEEEAKKRAAESEAASSSDEGDPLKKLNLEALKK